MGVERIFFQGGQ